jgi:GNAT superfamily N-acetyltransferase
VVSDLVALKPFIFGIFSEFNLERLARWYDEHPGSYEKEWPTPGQERTHGHVLRRNGDICGCATLVPREDAPSPDEGEVAKLYLAKDLRGIGLGRALLDDLVMHARTEQYRTLFLTTRVEWQDAITLYTRTGFSVIPNERYPGAARTVEMRMTL